ncbi:MAG: 30S ribosomal protein S8 [Candidatus Micrarchaeota archaeon]
MSIDLLADALNTLKTHEIKGEERCEVRASRTVSEVFRILREKGYIASYEFIDDGKGGYFDVKLSGTINDCGVIKPRFPVKKSEWAKLEERYIPGVGVGLLVVSTPQGIMTNTDAQERQIGGRLLAFVY